MDKKNLALAIQLRHELHMHPELSYQEVWTKQHLINFLKKHTTNLVIIDKGKYFYAKYTAGKDKPTLAFRADFDALPIPETIELPWKSTVPGVSHKCGHDGHSATLAGFALEVDQKGADQNIVFLFQHAEETGQGGIECAEVILEEKIDEIFGYHNMSGIEFNTVHVIDGTAHCASKGMSIEMIGSPAHASQPENGINPSFAIARIIDNLVALTSPDKYEGLVLCTIIQVDIGSENYGIAAYNGTLRLTIRAEKEAELNMLQQSIEELALKLGKEQGITVHFHYQDEFPETVNHKDSVDKVRQVAAGIGFPLRELTTPYRASEDYGHYLKLVKGAYFYIGNGETHPPIHTYEYDFRDEIIEIGVEMFKGLAGIRT
ncbi:M20 metallopeptidase family protein [Bacillus sp. REN16]|uniref:M20 metallopeptidase family protein n=1 Tax=Bacillus sp. REN16 TaxID=2887296 RepID=UPI001E5CEBB4|nr:amidohydrolase [Bacillus sp. REN16]MCC3357045.1 amidohydrolase [Bacillus sp. REN16]